MAAPQASSRLEMLQARFQQKQLQEKEQKLLQLYDQQQQRAYQVVQRGSAGSNSSNHGSTVRTAMTTTTSTTTTTTTTHTTSTSQGGKVRQMFDERRQTTVKGIDRSYPLEPLENKLRKQVNTNGVVTQRNGNVTVNRQSVKRVSRADVNSNVNGGKPVISYHEEIIRDSFGPSVRRHDDEDEYGVENAATFANGHYRHEIDNEQEEALDQDMIERNRMMAKIHLMGFDETLKHRVRNDLESEEFPEYLMVDVPDKLSKRNVTKKLSQAEERLERFKNVNAKRSNVPKQSRKRSEQAIKSNSRLRSEIAGASSTSARSGSSWTSEHSQRILENAKSPVRTRNTYVTDEVNARRRESSDIETLSQRMSPRSFSTREAIKAKTTSRFYPHSNEFKSLTSDGKIFVRRSVSPQFFCRESERSATTMSLDQKSDSPGSSLSHQETLTKRNRSPRFFLNESEQFRRTSESKSLVWDDTGILSRQSTSPKYFYYELKRPETAMSTDRETIGSKLSEQSKGILTKRDVTDFERKKVQTSTLGRQSSQSKSPLYEEKMLKGRSISPQFFCRESEQSATTMSIDRAASESRSSSHDQKIVTNRSASPRYRESKRPETAMSTDRETIGSKLYKQSKGILTKRDVADFERKKVQTSTTLGRQSSQSKSPLYEEKMLKGRRTSPQFFCRESERSATTMSIDRATSESRSSSHDREIVTKRSASPRFFLHESKSPIWSDRGISSRQSTSPQYRESKRPETAMSTDRETIGSKLSEQSKGILTKRDVTDFERKKVQTSATLGRQSSQSKSPLYEEKMLKRRSISPQFFCRESEQSATTMSIDRVASESRSSSHDQKIVTNRSASPRYRESKRPETAMSTDREIIGSKLSKQSKGILTKRDVADFERKKVQTSTTLGRQSSQSKSPLYEEKMLKGRSTSPQFFCRESERSATTMSIDRATSESRSPSYDQKIVTNRSASPRFFLHESKSPIWSDRGISSRQSTSPQYREPKRSETMSTDRETIGSKSSERSKEILTQRDLTDFERKKVRTSATLGRQSSQSKSPLYEEKMLKRRSTSPQFFCRESERSATTMNIDRTTSESRSPSYDREIITKRSASPRFFLHESKSPIWDGRGILSSTSQYRESKRSETAMSTDRETIESEFSEWSKRNTKPRFFSSEPERYGMNIDRKVSEPRSLSYDQKIFTKRNATPQLLKNKKQRSAATTSIDRKYSGSKSSRITRDKHSTSPQFFCKESKKSATTMLIEPRSRSTDSTKNVLKQRNYNSDTSYRRSVKSPIDKKVSSMKFRHTPSPLVDKHEVKRISSKNEASNNITEVRRSSKISETSATSASSIVNLKYGLEFDNIFQSAGLVRKFMKSQNGKQRTIRQSPLKRNITNVQILARGSQSKNQRKTSPLLQTTRSPFIKDRKRATPEYSRKTITPTEVDVDIQEITMTDHRIELDKLQKASSPISKRQFDGTKSPYNRMKFKTSITYPVRKTNRQRRSVLESNIFKGNFSERRSLDRRSNRESEESVISLSKFSPVSSCIITRDRKDKNRSSQTREQSTRNQTKYIATQSTKHEDRQRASSRSTNQTRNRSAEKKADTRNRSAEKKADPKAKLSSDFLRIRKYPDTVSPILYDFAERTKGGPHTKFDQLQSLRSTRLVQSAAKDRNLSIDDKYNQERGEDKYKNVTVDKVDAEIGVKYQTVDEISLNEIKDYRKITRPNSADGIINKKVFLRETQKPMKSSTSKKTISPTRECGRRHDVKSKVSPHVSSLRKTAEISRDIYTPKISSSQSIVSKADQSSKFSYTTKDRNQESVLVAKKLAESFKNMSVKRKTEEPKDGVKEFSKILRGDKYEKDLKRIDSVESALKRFDSIDTEFERSSPTNFQASPEISLQMIDIQTKASIKESIASEGTTVPAREVTDHTILRSMLKSPVDKGLETKNVAYKSDLKIPQKETRFSKKSTRVESKQRSTKIRLPTCKRRLFESDSEKEIQEERPKSNFVKVRKNENCSFVNYKFRKDKKRRSKDLSHDVTRESMRFSEEKTPTFSVKPLRSIEDIRKSIDNEQNKLIVTKESRSAIANRRSASREGVDAKRSSPATNAAKNVFLSADPARSIKIKSRVSRITKSPSPDLTATKQRETNVRVTRGSAPSSPSKSPEIAPRRITTESRNQEAKPSKRSTVAKGADSTRGKVTAGAVDTAVDGVLQNGSPNESMTKKSNAFVIDFDDRPSKEDDATPLKKSSIKKSSNDKQQTASSASGRPISSSNSSFNLIQDSSAKGRMAESERGKGTGKGGGKSKGKSVEKASSNSGKLVANVSNFNEDTTTDTKGLVKCKICGRSFAQNRISLHEDICTKTTTKKRKQFDPVMSRVKGTELEPFVKKSLAKRETKTKKPETKPDWRRKHEEFINAIRYARETQARLAAGGNLSDLPPPPPSDTSDYIQCDHCGRKFNRSAAERHIPICKRMHDKKQTQAPKRR